MQITIFSDNHSKFTGYIIQTLEHHEFVPMIDGIHGNDMYWLQHHFQCPHRFYWVCQESANVEQFTSQELHKPPHFSIHFNQDQFVTDFEWNQILGYIQCIVKSEEPNSRTKRCINNLKTHVAAPTLLKQPDQPTLPQFYEFNSKMIEDQDIAVFEIKKANCTTPYTTIIRQFSIKGYKPLFTNYFACNAFRKDFIAIQFLMKLWNEFMEGPMDLDDMLKEATESCYPGENYVPIAEPEVYNKSLEHVLELLNV